MLTLQEILTGIRQLNKEEKNIVKAELFCRSPRNGKDLDTYLEEERSGE